MEPFWARGERITSSLSRSVSGWPDYARHNQSPTATILYCGKIFLDFRNRWQIEKISQTNSQLINPILQVAREGTVFNQKIGDDIVDSSQAKSTIQTGNLCYYTVNVNVLDLMDVYN